MATVLFVFKVAEFLFPTKKPQTEDTQQMELVLVINENSDSEIDLYTYLRLIVNEIMWVRHKLRY